MYTFSQLLIRNVFFGLAFLAAMSVASLFSLSQYLTNVQENQQEVIHLLANNQNENIFDAKSFAQNLTKITPYLQLSITSKTDGLLFNYLNAKPMQGLNLVNPKAQQFTLAKQDVIIEFQRDYAIAFRFLIQLLLTLSGLTVFFIFVSTIFSYKRYNKIFSRFSKQIQSEISSILSPKAKANNGDTFDIPALKDGLKEIYNLIELEKENSLSLKKHAYIDPLTHLNNRNRFIQYFEDSVRQDDKIKCGVLIMTRCSELQTINQIHGFNEGDQYISGVADILKSALANYSSAQLFRLNSSDFAAVVPNIKLKEAENYAKELSRQFNDYQQASDLDSVAYSGLVYFEQDKPLGELLALADTFISVAQTQQINSWYAQNNNDVTINNNNNASAYGNQNWRQEIDAVIENKRVTLLVQHIQPNSRNTKMYGEILARFLNDNEEMLPTASFIAMAEKLDKIVDIDRLIIDTAIIEIGDKNIQDHSFGINISARTIHDEQFLVWLERRLLREPNIASRLIFEISEYGLQQNIRTSKRFIDMLHRVGSRMTVERFGVGFTSFKFFRELKPDFIKMDSTYTRDIDDDKNNQYFLRLMVDLAHRLSISVLAESVESQEEKHALEKLFIDGCQGFYIGKPTKL